jgi:Hint domain
MSAVKWQTKSGNWNVARNWNSSTVPGSEDDVTIDKSNGTCAVTYDLFSSSIASLQISQAKVTLSFVSNTTLAVRGLTNLNAGRIDVLASGATLSTGTLTTAASTVIDIGNGGTLTIGSGGGTIDGLLECTAGVGIVNGSIGGTGTVEAVASTLDIKGAIVASSGLHFTISGNAASLLAFDSTVGSNNSFSFLGSAGLLDFNNGAILTQTVSGLAVGTSNLSSNTNYIEVHGAVAVSDSTNKYSGTAATIHFDNGSTLTLKDVLGGSGAWYVDTVTTANGDTDIFLSDAVCYAAGTRILTATGERTVESLLQGDIVLTLIGDELSAHPIKWIGRRRIDLTTHPRPETVAPVRIQRHAFADNKPHTDLFVSPDHALFVDGTLIAARQLVNGSTIRQETSQTSVKYFHVELDHHAILLAEGLPAESYLDTGNRGFFANSSAPLVLHPDLTDESDCPAREANSCAPFAWDEATVRPVWQRLADRAATLGRPAVSPETTRDSDLHLVVKGRAVRPLYAENELFIFALPRGATEAQLVSRAAAPADARPWLDDRRMLGVQVQQIVVRDAAEVTTIALDDPILSQGWWDVERDGLAMRRWTNGSALLPLPHMQGVSMLEIRAGGLDYVVGNDRRAVA